MTQWYRRVFRRAPRDPITEQLRDLERQGAGEAQVMRSMAFVIVVAFSMGALITIAADPFTKFINDWRAGTFNFVQGASFVVSVLLVIGADFALLWAARVTQAKLERGQGGKALHISTMIAVASVDSVTFLAMSIIYDKPATFLTWLIVVIRAVFAPYIMIYLRMARAQTLGANDMLYQAARATGEGVVRKMVYIARDPRAPLERLLRLWRASERMKPGTLAQVDALMQAERETRDMASVTGLTQEFAPFIREAESLPAPAQKPMNYLAHPTSPRVRRPEPPDDWDGPDDNGPDNGSNRGRAGGDHETSPSPWFATGEIPAVPGASLNGNGHKSILNRMDEPDDWDADEDSSEDAGESGDSGDSGEYGRAAPSSRPRVAPDSVTRELAAEGKAARRKLIVAQMIRDNPAVKIGTVRKALRRKNVGAGDARIEVMMDAARDELGIPRPDDEESATETMPRLRAIGKQDRQAVEDQRRFQRALAMAAD